MNSLLSPPRLCRLDKCKRDGVSSTHLHSVSTSLFLLLASFLFLFHFVTSSSSLLPVSGAYASGSLYTTDSWRYIEKFCFDEAGGRVQFTFFQDPALAAAGNLTQMVSFYADIDEQWHSIYHSSLTCKEKVARASKSYPLQWLAIDGHNNTYGYDVVGIIPRWWYITVSNCEGGTSATEGALQIESYSIHFTNQPGLTSFEFSKDIQGIMEMSIFWFLFYALMLCVLAWIKQHAKSKSLQYTIVKYIFFSILLEFIALLFNLIHYTKYAHDGVGVEACETVYYFLDTLSNLVLLYVVLNISKGWTISTNYIGGRRVILLIIGLLFFLYIALFIWVQQIMDPASVLYIYETPPGWTVVGVRCVCTLYALYCMQSTYRLEREIAKKQFYLVWIVLATSWLISLPLIVGIAHEIETWKRRRVVFGLVNCVQCTMYIILTYLFRPFRSNRYVNILKPDETRAFGTNNMQVFPMVGPPVQFSSI